MRNDDPGNLIYAATGAEILGLLGDGDFKKQVLKGLSEVYALMTRNKLAKKSEQVTDIIVPQDFGDSPEPWFFEAAKDLIDQESSLSEILKELQSVLCATDIALNAGAFDMENLDVALFDDAHDIAVINWGYEAYVRGIIKETLSSLGLRKVLKFLQKKDK